MGVIMERIINLAKQYGFVYQGSEIYNGLANTWDYGPLGVELKNNLKQYWWDVFVHQEPNNVGLDSSILLNPTVWEASGHVGGFSDPLIDCKNCRSRFRADKLIEESNEDLIVDGWENQKMLDYIYEHKLVCPKCGSLDYTDIRSFNLMFKTFMGVVEDSKNTIYLRPETAQGIFINFKNIMRTTRKKLPLGVGQIGKSFRNEITPGNFIFRTREFEQMEMEVFCKPGTELEIFDYYLDKMQKFLTSLGFNSDVYRIREHSQEELCHYSNRTVDIEYKFPFGWGELWGLASRTDFDLKAHQEKSKVDMSYLDPTTNEKFIPYVVEPSVGADRLFLALLLNSYEEEVIGVGETREVLHLPYQLAPYKVCVMPLVKKLEEPALAVFNNLCNDFNVDYDVSGAIGKRYRRQDVIGTPFCVTFDYDSLEDGCVTVRERDSMQQERIKIEKLSDYLKTKISK